MTKETELPDNLPVPVDDGACDHLVGLSLPNIELPSTENGKVNLSESRGRIVIYIYPISGPDNDLLPEHWDEDSWCKRLYTPSMLIQRSP